MSTRVALPPVEHEEPQESGQFLRMPSWSSSVPTLAEPVFSARGDEVKQATSPEWQAAHASQQTSQQTVAPSSPLSAVTPRAAPQYPAHPVMHGHGREEYTCAHHAMGTPETGTPPTDTVGSDDQCEGQSEKSDNERERPQPRNDVKCFKVELANGETGVVVESSVTGKRWRFDKKSVDFELRADAESLANWLEGLKDQQMPGLLTLLAGEVTERGDMLKALEKDRDGLRGTEDYEFFGLDSAECTDKDLERAYRKMSKHLHPDKGGDEASFDEMRKKFEQIQSLRSEGKRKEGGGSIRWDPNCRSSMLKAHSDLREQLIWITNHVNGVGEEVEKLRKRQSLRHTLTWIE